MRLALVLKTLKDLICRLYLLILNVYMLHTHEKLIIETDNDLFDGTTKTNMATESLLIVFSHHACTSQTDKCVA